MRKGYNPGYELSSKGEIFAIWTGSDACAEHEMDSKELLSSLTLAHHSAEEYGQLARKSLLELKVPKIEERRAIIAKRGIVFQQNEKIAVIGFGFRGDVLNHRGLHEYSSDKDGCTGAWDERSFGFALHGKYSKKLQNFFEEMESLLKLEIAKSKIES